MGTGSYVLHEPFVALGQGTGGDQDTAQVVESLAGRQLVNDLAGQRAGVAADLGEDLPDLGAVQPGHSHVGPLGPGQSPVKRGEAGADPAGLVTDEGAYPLVQGAALAGTRAEQPGRLAGRAAIPEVRVGVEALRAQRRLAGAASCPVIVSAPTPNRLVVGCADSCARHWVSRELTWTMVATTPNTLTRRSVTGRVNAPISRSAKPWARSIAAFQILPRKPKRPPPGAVTFKAVATAATAFWMNEAIAVHGPAAR